MSSPVDSDDVEIVAAVSGALLSLTYAHNWEQFGAITPDEIAAAMQTMYLQWLHADGEACIYALADDDENVLTDDADLVLFEG